VAFFTSGGSDAIDSAAKIARRFWAAQGQPERRIVIARDGAYHGVNAFGTSLSGIEANAAGWGPLVSEVVHVGRDDLAALERTLEHQRGRVAAFVGEPVQGAAGVYPPVGDYWQGVQDLCRAHDVLLIADEVITGFGRLGRWFGSERYGIVPDMICGAKGLTSGYMPMGVVVANARVRDAVWAAGTFRHGYTYSGHATAAAVALGNLDIIAREGLVQRVAELEPVLAQEVAPLAEHRLVGEVRTVGLLAGVELAEGARADDPGIAERVVRAARGRGVLVRNLLGRTLQISPPFVIAPEELRLLGQVLADALDEVRLATTR
jgi:adenosylmethionine-8-amino-7-oxononanoate aminotransferase